MANLFRIAFACVLLCSSMAFAALSPAKLYSTPLLGSATFGSAGAACSALVGYLNGDPGYATYTFSGPRATEDACTYDWAAKPPLTNSGTTTHPITSSVGECPAGSIAGTNAHGEAICTCAPPLRESNGQCTALPPHCEQGYQWDEALQQCVIKPCGPNQIRVNNVCVDDPDKCPDGKPKVNGKCEPEKCPKPGTFAGEYKVGGISPSTFCENKCTVSITSFVRAVKDGKVQDTIGMGHYTGASCSGPGYTPPNPDKPNTPGNPDPNNPNNPNPNPGGGGGNNGGGNPPNSNGGNNPNPGGGSNNPVPEKCPNGNCTGNTGGKPTGGTETGTDGKCPPGYYKSQGKCWPDEPPESDPDTDGNCPPGTIRVNGKCVSYQPPSDGEQEEADEFCKKNPEVPMCKKSTFQGACQAGFSCDGDAIFCAIARDQHSRNCKLFDEPSDESNLYNKDKGKQGEQTKELPGNRTLDMAGRIDMTDALGGGQCVSDLSIVVMGQGITLPISRICPAISVIGNILVAVALLLAVRIVGRG